MFSFVLVAARAHEPTADLTKQQRRLSLALDQQASATDQSDYDSEHEQARAGESCVGPFEAEELLALLVEAVKSGPLVAARLLAELFLRGLFEHLLGLVKAAVEEIFVFVIVELAAFRLRDGLAF